MPLPPPSPSLSPCHFLSLIYQLKFGNTNNSNNNRQRHELCLSNCEHEVKAEDKCARDSFVSKSFRSCADTFVLLLSAATPLSPSQDKHTHTLAHTLTMAHAVTFCCCCTFYLTAAKAKHLLLLRRFVLFCLPVSPLFTFCQCACVRERRCARLSVCVCVWGRV